MKSVRPQIFFFAAIVAMLLMAIAAIGYGEPTAPLHFTRGSSSTFNWSQFSNVQTDAIAGNITQLTITGISQTRAWQGFWGNVSGWITLDDAQNYTFYNWSAAEPRGFVYASLVADGDPSWLSVRCFDMANNATNFDDFYNITRDAYDNVSETFQYEGGAYDTEWYIVNNSRWDCPKTYPFQNDAIQTKNFINSLFYDASKTYNISAGTAGWIFGAKIENKNVSDKTDLPCYNGQLCDFQLMVAEDGHGTDTAVTPYYIWVDITA